MTTEDKIINEINAEFTPEQLAKKWAPVNTKTQNLTMEKLQTFMPKGSSVKLTESILQTIHKAEDDTGIDQGLFEEQVCSYTHLLGPGISMEKLMNAIKFVTLAKVVGGNAKAYRIVFPDKTDEIESRKQTVDSFASMYNTTKAVVEVQKLNMIGTHILYAPLQNQIVQKYTNLMNGVGASPDDYVSPTVQLNATIAVETMIKQPGDTSMELKIGMSDSAVNVTQSIFEQLAVVAKNQKQLLEAGGDIGTVQRLGVTTDVVDVDVIND
tara:strand:+ start:1921 stop:2724 length:804 start_codon:yes stop_codon:yes gene_type:complete